MTYSDPKVTYSDPQVTYSDPKVIHCDPIPPHVSLTFGDIYVTYPCLLL